jgi:hypothetical protein
MSPRETWHYSSQLTHSSTFETAATIPAALGHGSASEQNISAFSSAPQRAHHLLHLRRIFQARAVSDALQHIGHMVAASRSR